MARTSSPLTNDPNGNEEGMDSAACVRNRKDVHYRLYLQTMAVYNCSEHHFQSLHRFAVGPLCVGVGSITPSPVARTRAAHSRHRPQLPPLLGIPFYHQPNLNWSAIDKRTQTHSETAENFQLAGGAGGTGAHDFWAAQKQPPDSANTNVTVVRPRNSGGFGSGRFVQHNTAYAYIR